MGRKAWTRLVAAVAVVAAVAATVGVCGVHPGLGDDRPAPDRRERRSSTSRSAPRARSREPARTTGTSTLQRRHRHGSGPGRHPGAGRASAFPRRSRQPAPRPSLFNDSPSYAAELQRLTPAPAGRKWVGYLSAVTNYSDTSGPQNAPVSLTLTLGQGQDGSPFVGPLSATIVLGGRQVIAAIPGTRPVVCLNPDITKPFLERHAPACEAGHLQRRHLRALDDHARPGDPLGGGDRQRRAGSLASVPFTLRYAGTATATANFNLSATTSLPNATVAVTPGALAPASNSDNQALVAVGIPAGARAGTYDVTLTAKLANGQTRTRIGKLTVTGRRGRHDGRGRPSS